MIIIIMKIMKIIIIIKLMKIIIIIKITDRALFLSLILSYCLSFLTNFSLTVFIITVSLIFILFSILHFNHFGFGCSF